MRRQLVLAFFVLACGAVWADGSPLFSNGPGISSAEIATIRKERPQATVVQSVVINREAINSKVTTATVDGKEFRFVGGQTEGGSKGIVAWAGLDGEASTDFVVEGRAVYGKVRFANRVFEFQSLKGKDVLIELVDTRDFSPEATAAARAAAEQKKAKP